MDPIITFVKASEALELAEGVVDGTIETGVLQTKVNEKLSALETQYAPRLTSAESQLAQIPNQTYITEKAKTVDVNNALALKAEKSYVDTEIQNMSNAVQGFYATVADLSTAFPTGNTNNYVVTADNYIYRWNGSAWASTGYLFNPNNIVNESIGATKLARSFKNRPNIASGVSLNTAVKDGTYLILTGALDLPSNFTSTVSGFLVVESIGDRWITQTLYELNNNNKKWFRTYDTTGAAVAWTEVKTLTTKSVIGDYIANGAIIPAHLSNGYDFKGSFTSKATKDYLNSGAYLFISATDVPSDMVSSCIMRVHRIGDRWISQELFSLTGSGGVKYARTFDSGGTVPAWGVPHNRNKGNLTSVDMNTVVTDGTYTMITPTNQPIGSTDTSGLLDVTVFGLTVLQKYVGSPSNDSYIRFFNSSSPPTNGTGWKKIRYYDNSPNTQLLVGEKVVNFGDSRIGNKLNAESVSYAIAQKTGATVYNCGFGGTRMSTHDQYWDAFSMYRLADEIVKDSTDVTKWVLQDNALANDGGILPWQYDGNLETLKGIDFNTVDYITIDLGTNDWTANKPLNNEADLYDVSTFKGALRYSLEKILTKYRHLKIMIVTPTYRFWVDGTTFEFIEDSDTKLQNGVTLDAFVQACKDVAKEYKLPCLDNYHELGFNKFNRTLYFDGADGTHPNVTGNTRMGDKYGSALISNF